MDKLGKDWTKPGNMVSNGAYVLKDWQVNSKVVVEKNPTYWDAANVQLTRVTFLCVEDANADLKLYQSGEEDFMQQLAPGAYTALKAQYPNEMHNGPLLGLRFYGLNNNDPLLKDVRVRKALSMVIDRDILSSKVTADGQAPLYGLAVKGLAGINQTRYDWADWPMDKRVAEARKLLAEAGVKPGTHLKFTYNNSDYHKKMAIFAASEWKTKLGLETDMDSLEFKVLIRKRHDGDFQIARHGWVATFNDATIFLTLVQCGSDSNDDRNCNRKADELIAQGNLSTDPATRAALLTQGAKLVMDDYPMIPLLQYSVPRLIKPWVGGYDDANGLDRYRSKEFFILKH
jgi:oligopeptide transport system substrate-binding protein